MNRMVLPASLLALLCALSASGVQGQCVPSQAITSSIGLIEQPFPYTDLRPALTTSQIDALPPLPDPTEEIPREEHAYISTALAADLGIAPHDATGGDLTVDPNWQRPNPQIRVRITNPATFSNWKEGTTYRDRASNAIFTVVGVIQNTNRIVWIYDGLDGATVEDDSGQYKLFAEDTVVAGDREPEIRTFADANSDGRLDTVTASVYCSPVSRSIRSHSNGSTTYNHYTENDAHGGRLQEQASKPGDNRFALLVPHGGGIEPGTSEQINVVTGVILGVHDIPLNKWHLYGHWGDEQDAERWHITATSLSERSFPALRWMLDQPWYNPSHPFRYALALHGFGSDTLDLIIGGRASLNDKCHVASEIKAAGGTGPVAIRIYHDESLIDVPADGGRKVCREGLSGWSTRNIVNRLAAAGGIQIEQSEGVLANSTYRGGVALGAGRALGDLLDNTEPANACADYDDPVHEDEVEDCEE